ncbi:SMP-30/gluconolactonase/LRE family protein [Rhizobiaceae bacterium CRRU44]|uniref:SMP-30/gluconolactonase/LRE family protein n=1 Tax=Ferranicluibacter rubi TaxID=2715133 RepID=A0AA43ZAA0_9HYPH|nr:SMP-30/gluconolactonase/LRE family protein [Ferranicluibacter rubi]NHT74139.1 SMP-30/gluconolactonase/LRE family protein [Ferranicluibacter rubi]
MSANAKIVSDNPSELGEGPVYDPSTGTVWWFNIVGRELHGLHLESQAKSVQPLNFLASVMALVDGERQLIASDQGLFLRDAETGVFETYGVIEDKPGNRTNDGRVHASGALWISTMGRSAEKNAGAIYHVAKGKVTRIVSDITIPNGICFSPDGRTGYYSDTGLNRFMRVALDPATGLPTGEPALMVEEPESEGGFDGAVCDAEGLIWAARWGASAIDVYSPEGKRLARHTVPVSQPSCPAFVGRSADRLLFTSAWQGLDEAGRSKDPDAGKTFLLDIDVKGRFEPVYVL